jgi:hypothetical protein
MFVASGVTTSIPEILDRLSPVRMGPLGKPPALPSTSAQGWANLDQAHEDLDRNIFRDLSPTPKP